MNFDSYKILCNQLSKQDIEDYESLRRSLVTSFQPVIFSSINSHFSLATTTLTVLIITIFVCIWISNIWNHTNCSMRQL